MMEVFSVLSVIGWLGATLFLGIYHHSSRWWEHGYGRSLFMLGLVAFSFFTTAMLHNIFGDDYPGRNTLRVVNLLLGVGMVWYLLYTLVRQGAAVRRKRRQQEQDVVQQPR